MLQFKADQQAQCETYKQTHLDLLRRYNELLNELSGRVQQSYDTEQVAQMRREQRLGEQLSINFSSDIKFFENIVQGQQVIDIMFTQWDGVHAEMKAWLDSNPTQPFFPNEGFLSQYYTMSEHQKNVIQWAPPDAEKGPYNYANYGLPQDPNGAIARWLDKGSALIDFVNSGASERLYGGFNTC